MNPLIIKSVRGGTQIELREHDTSSFIAIINDKSLQASAVVYHAGIHAHIDVSRYPIEEFFADLAKNWNGWSGSKKWESLEATMKFEATADRMGHITLAIDLDNGTPYNWRVKALVIIEAGQLEKLSKDAHEFTDSISAA